MSLRCLRFTIIQRTLSNANGLENRNHARIEKEIRKIEMEKLKKLRSKMREVEKLHLEIKADIEELKAIKKS